ncbi:MFS transporter [Achromobacter seleniivolatilans]|uniref:MFS transporter n=1 Tax=Achromobacter seleniivolatilans TaxID=3047478 RepID=A0ABY9M4Y9_9BURK|nr:MFS transporter [Achromobacter sp. R39]WMD22064.1 MFS transporter [Achromobacter sp. R39]
MSSSRINTWRIVVIVLVGLNLRPVLASVPPLLDLVLAATRMSDTVAGLLTALPVFVMGLGALSVAPLRRLLGEELGVVVGLALITAATAGRLWAGNTGLMLATGVVAGLGIAVAQALLPIYIKTRFATGSSGVMGLYSTAIMGGAAVASVASPLMAQRASWLEALAVWSLPAAAAMLGWLLVMRLTAAAQEAVPIADANATPSPVPPSALAPVPTPRSRIWLLAVFFGLGTGAYTLVLAWLPPYYTALGWTPVAAGQLLGAVTAAEIVAGLLVSLCIGRLPDRRIALFLAIGALALGLMGWILAPAALAWPAAVLAGLGIGALFPLSLIVAMDHARTSLEAGRLASFVQGIGYLIAALFPFAAGLIRQHLSDLTPAWILMTLICLVLFAMASRFRPQPATR